MNLLTLIFVVMLVFSLTDFIYPAQEKLHNQLYYVALFVAWFLFGIKYYYGPDIMMYVPLYEKIESPCVLLSQGSVFAGHFEIGYLWFCSILHHVGISYWGMTIILNTLYFYTIHKLFRQIPSKKIFALFLLIILDYNLIYIEYRQCIGVCCFILMLLAYVEKKFFKAFVLFTIVSLVHKSGLYIASCTLLTLMLWGNYRVGKSNYWFLGLILVALCLISTKEISLLVTQSLPLSVNTVNSIVHHLSLERKIQVAFLLYFIAICTVPPFLQDGMRKKDMRVMSWVVLVAFAIIVCFYQYWYLLQRLRSYFLPVIIVFIFRLVYSGNSVQLKMKHRLLIKQISIVTVYAICLHYMVRTHVAQGALESKIAEASTIFERMHKSEEEIKARQLKKARIYWERDFEKQF